VPSILNNLDLVEKLLRGKAFGLITDVDGTISPTAPTPRQARVSPLCHRYLSILCKRLTLVAALSGRPATEVKDMLNIDGMVYVGNHGLERWVEGRSEFMEEAQEYGQVIEAVVEELNPLLSIEGIIIENKGVTTTVHYRLCDDHRSAKRKVLSAIENSPHARGLRIMQESKYAINILPPVQVDKGTCILSLIQEYDLRGGIYMGDDITDIYAFRAIRTATGNLDFHGYAIGVTGPEMPDELTAEVDFTLDGVGDVERFLKWMSDIASQPASNSAVV